MLSNIRRTFLKKWDIKISFPHKTMAQIHKPFPFKSLMEGRKHLQRKSRLGFFWRIGGDG